MNGWSPRINRHKAFAIMEPHTPEVMDSFTVSINLVMTNEAGHTFYLERNYVGGLDAVTARSGAKPQYFFERPQPGSSAFLAHNHSVLVFMVCRYREINPEVDVSTSQWHCSTRSGSESTA